MYYLFIIVTFAITLGAQAYLNSQYNKCAKIMNNKGITGLEVARMILDKNGLKDVGVLHNSGVLSDHYDPRSKVVRLSDSIYSKTSIASVSVAAHECGHAIQDKTGYAFLRFRKSITPFVSFASMAGYIAIMIGIFAGALNIFWFGIFCEAFILLFQLITLPVEFDASKRGLNELIELGLVDNEELSNCKGMLTAAALTYVAAVATSLLEILRLVLMARRRDWFYA